MRESENDRAGEREKVPKLKLEILTKSTSDGLSNIINSQKSIGKSHTSSGKGTKPKKDERKMKGSQ